MTYRILIGDALEQLKTLPAESIQCCVTSPPYWGLRDYGIDGQFGIEKTPEEYVSRMVDVFQEVKRVLRKDGTLWLNIGDSYAGGKQGNDSFGASSSTLNNGGRNTKTGEKMRTIQRKPPAGLKPKDLVGIPWMLAFALRADGWYLRCDIIWSKPNPMPESVTDRPTKAHEYIFLLTKSPRYYYDAKAISEPMICGNHERKGIPGTLIQAPGQSVQSGITKRRSQGGAALGPKADKQRGHSRRHAGFNDRWDLMNKEEQCSGMRNKRSVWNVATEPFPEAHFATYPRKLIEPCILAGSKHDDIVLDPFCGSGTTGLVAIGIGRNFIGIELNRQYAAMTERRIWRAFPLLVVAE